MTYDSEMYSRPALVTSASLAWQGLRVERYQLDAMELPPHRHDHHLLLLYQAPPVTVRRQQGSRVQQAVFQPGNLGLYPGGEYDRVSWNGPTDTIHLYLDNQQLEDKARRDMDLSRFYLGDQFRFDDGLLNALGQQLLSAVGTSHTLGWLYVESLINTLCFHLIEHYGRYERRPVTTGRLPNAALNRIDAYLEAYADQFITLDTLAGLANLSVFHFTRLFKHAIGVSPYQYVLDWKIRRARQLLRANDTSINSVSDALGFSSPAHFSVAFKRNVGMSPSQFQRG
ncbi:helix-turn-helix transcriptional regulator [Spirosoma utsteinense]|uniref:AraC family transcriptional regulator n=1 Tax=Spirosoma utsteinense TaxID=2585773 RepID=A0ABR6W9L6_9BACT|nr:helix-turn-helix transcriptional regulator [Spirosoma utsteinense]MBC3787657.1 AraC family transcriptional regulator [Spirosoma utsteinense]MBC3793253.1 AraC family transcriptional regulator [Spirosoma utsteinense]